MLCHEAPQDFQEYYKGEFVHGLPHGHGTCLQSNRDVYTGDWAFGLMYGQVALTRKDGTVYRGKYVNGRKHVPPLAHCTRTVADVTVSSTPSVSLCLPRTLSGIVHAHNAKIAVEREQAVTDEVSVLALKIYTFI